MPDAVSSFLLVLFGRDGEPAALTSWQVVARAALVYLYGLAILRVAGHRVLGRYGAIDIVAGIVLGSILSRPVNGEAPLGLTLVAATGIVAVHWALSAAACRWSALSVFAKGRPVVLIHGGRVVPEALRRHHLGRHDLEEALRLAGHRADPSLVAEALLERNGRISVIARVEDGVGHEQPAPGS